MTVAVKFSLSRCCCCVLLLSVLKQGFHFTTGFRKLRKQGETVWDCQAWLIKRPQEGWREWLRKGGKEKKRKGGQREGEKEVKGARGGRQWAFWWGLSGEHMWVMAWINRLSLPWIDDLHTHPDTHTEPHCVVYVPFLAIYTLVYTYHSYTGRGTHRRTHIATLSCIHCLCLSISLIYGCGPIAPSL